MRRWWLPCVALVVLVGRDHDTASLDPDLAEAVQSFLDTVRR